VSVAPTIDINRTPEEVFAYVNDYRNDPHWRSIRSMDVDPDGPAQVGTRLREVAQVAGLRLVTHSVVATLVPGTSHTWEVTSGRLTLRGERRVEAAPHGTGQASGARARLVDRLDLWVPKRWRWSAPLVRLVLAAAQGVDLRRLKQLLEAGRRSVRPDRPAPGTRGPRESR
jgi:uncharacterized membrane protein